MKARDKLHIDRITKEINFIAKTLKNKNRDVFLIDDVLQHAVMVDSFEIEHRTSPESHQKPCYSASFSAHFKSNRLIRWAETWDWGVGAIFAGQLRGKCFTDWEAVVAAMSDEKFAGICTLVKEDNYGTDLDFTRIKPFIGAVYVDPEFRGRRVCGKVLDAACDYARSLGFDAVYGRFV